MAVIKYLSFILIFVAVTSAVSNSEWTTGLRQIKNFHCEDDVDGQKDWIILAREIVSRKGKYLQIVESTITYPPTDNKDCIITCIKVTDLTPDTEHGYPMIQNGGRGFTYVTLSFTSQRSKGFKFEVEIWCKKKPSN